MKSVPRIARLVKNGVGAFVGGSPVVNAAREAGAHGVHIDMEKRVIYDAIEESIRIVRLHKEKDLRLGTINALLDSISEGIIGLDEETITEINRNAQGLFGLERQAVPSGTPSASSCPRRAYRIPCKPARNTPETLVSSATTCFP